MPCFDPKLPGNEPELLKSPLVYCSVGVLFHEVSMKKHRETGGSISCIVHHHESKWVIRKAKMACLDAIVQGPERG